MFTVLFLELFCFRGKGKLKLGEGFVMELEADHSAESNEASEDLPVSIKLQSTVLKARTSQTLPTGHWPQDHGTCCSHLPTLPLLIALFQAAPP